MLYTLKAVQNYCTSCLCTSYLSYGDEFVQFFTKQMVGKTGYHSILQGHTHAVHQWTQYKILPLDKHAICKHKYTVVSYAITI